VLFATSGVERKADDLLAKAGAELGKDVKAAFTPR